MQKNEAAFKARRAWERVFGVFRGLMLDVHFEVDLSRGPSRKQIVGVSDPQTGREGRWEHGGHRLQRVSLSGQEG